MDTQTTSAQFEELLTEEWEARLRQQPTYASLWGDHRYDDRLPVATEEGYARWLDYLCGVRARLDGIDPGTLPPDQQLNYEIFMRLIQNEIDELGFHAYRLPLSRVMGFHIELPEELPLIARLETVEDYETYVARLVAIRRYFEEQIELMRGGLATGYRPARCILEGVDESLQKHLSIEVEESLLHEPFTRFPASISGASRQRLADEGRVALLRSVVPAYQALLRFLEDEYLPGARQEVGASHLPKGREFYQHRIHTFTSLDLSPEQIHQIGRSEVERIQAEMEDVMRQVDFEGDLAAFVKTLRTDPQFYANTPEDLLKETAYILKRMDGQLPRLFKTLPRMPYGIRPIPEASAADNTTAYYWPPSGDGRTAGIYYVNTYDLKSRPLYEIEALSLHEAVPGHHLQVALQQELDLPPFRRFRWFTEFVEGWALYAERLGLEVGFFTDPYSNFGRLSYEMWRACRLVVDTGLHALGWSRQRAIDYMAAHTSSTLLNITNEVDRYIAWPGQALAYKIGELKIRKLRARAEGELGPRFDLRAFHDLVLGSGALPLDLLQRKVEEALRESL